MNQDQNTTEHKSLQKAVSNFVIGNCFSCARKYGEGCPHPRFNVLKNVENLPPDFLAIVKQGKCEAFAAEAAKETQMTSKILVSPLS